MVWRALPLVLVAVGLVACGSSPDPRYDDAYRRAFAGRCQRESDQPAAVCSCWYQGLEDQIPAADLPSLDQLVGGDRSVVADRQPGDPVDDAMAILAACARRVGQPAAIGATVPPPTLPRSPADSAPAPEIPADTTSPR